MNDAVGIIGFYFTLIGFISGLFFTRIDSWYGSVRAFSAKVNTFKKRDDYITAEGEAGGLSASAPTVSFLAVGVLLLLLSYLAFRLPTANAPVDPTTFLHIPIFVTVLAYWAGGAALLLGAKSLLSKAKTRIATGISGG